MTPEDVAAKLGVLARKLAPRTKQSRVEVSDERRGRIVTTNQTVNGRRIIVQKRRAFAVYVGEGPVKRK